MNNGPNELLVLDQNNRTVRLITGLTATTGSGTASPGTVSSIHQFTQGTVPANGDFRAARFSNNLKDIYRGADGSIYVLDCGNNVVHKLYFTPQ